MVYIWNVLSLQIERIVHQKLLPHSSCKEKSEETQSIVESGEDPIFPKGDNVKPLSPQKESNELIVRLFFCAKEMDLNPLSGWIFQT